MRRRISTVSLFLGGLSIGSFAQTVTPWTWSNPLPVGEDLNAIAAFTDGRVLLFGEGGTYLRSVDNGAHWTPRDYPAGLVRITAVNFPSSTVGYILGDDADLTGKVAKTTDGGITWSILPNNSIAILTSVSFVDTQNGWVSGSGGVVLKTTNGGTSWTQLTTNRFDYLASIHFTSSNKGTAAAQGGFVLETANGGSSWSLRTTGTTSDIAAVRYTPSGIAYAVGPAGHAANRQV